MKPGTMTAKEALMLTEAAWKERPIIAHVDACAEIQEEARYGHRNATVGRGEVPRVLSALQKLLQDDGYKVHPDGDCFGLVVEW